MCAHTQYVCASMRMRARVCMCVCRVGCAKKMKDPSPCPRGGSYYIPAVRDQAQAFEHATAELPPQPSIFSSVLIHEESGPTGPDVLDSCKDIFKASPLASSR